MNRPTTREARPPSTLRDALSSLLSDHPHDEAVEHVIENSIGMALAYLHQKARLGSLRPKRFGLSLQDLALDSTAELFKRDEFGRFVDLRDFFDSINWRELDEVELKIALRRIVFSKVNEELFRRFRENDPNLGKVIRNVKDAVRSFAGLRLERQDHKLWLILGQTEPLARKKPIVPPELVEVHVTSALGSSGNTHAAISALAAILEMNPHYRNGFPVTELAKVVRSAFIRLGASTADTTIANAAAAAYSKTEVARAIAAASTAVRKQFFSTYVEKKKIDMRTFTVYLQTVRDVIESEYVYDTSSIYSHFDAMATHDPSLSEDEYRRLHRNRIEYMVKTARAHLAEYLTDVRRNGDVRTDAPGPS